MNLEIPYYQQETWYYCAPAVLQMVFSYFGVQVEQGDIAKLLKTNADSKGTLCGRIECVTCAVQLKCDVVKNAQYKKIQRYLRQDMPVIVNYFDTKTGTGHYAVATACDDVYITLNDPTYGKGHMLSREKFIEHWYCGCGCSKKWMVAIGKNENAPECELKKMFSSKLLLSNV